MPELQTESDLLETFADNKNGRISAKDIRDFVLATNVDGVRAHLIDTTNPHEVTAAQTGALVSVGGLSNPGGDVNLVGDGSFIEVTPNSETHELTISYIGSSGGGGSVNKYSALIGDGVSSTITILRSTHGCAGNRTNYARINEESTGEEVDCSITYSSNGDVIFGFSVAPTTNEYRIVIIG